MILDSSIFKASTNFEMGEMILILQVANLVNYVSFLNVFTLLNLQLSFYLNFWVQVFHLDDFQLYFERWSFWIWLQILLLFYSYF